jgi:transglutaminase-like putative cysteine protease
VSPTVRAENPAARPSSTPAETPPGANGAGPAARGPWRPGPPLLGVLAGWIALFAWSGLVVEPLDFLMPTLFIGVLMALAGSGLRMLGVAAYAVAAVQLLVALVSMNLIFASGRSLLGVLPTGSSVRAVLDTIGNGAATLNHYIAPVEANARSTQALLMVCGLAVIFAIDVLAMGLRRPPLIALPLLVTLSIPVSIMEDALALPVFVGTALVFFRLLASDPLDSDVTAVAGAGPGMRASFASSAGPGAATGRGLNRLWQVSSAAIVVSLLAAPLIPVADLLERGGGGEGPGGGFGNGFALSTVNPFVRLRRDLVTKTNTPLVYAETESRSTSYVRTTVLDEFTSDDWRPSSRSLPPGNEADGTFPSPPGLSVGTGGVESEWSLQLARGVTTTWLPLPYPIRELDVEGRWRYDSRTLDVAYVGDDAPQDLSYGATAFTPSISPNRLDAALPAADRVRVPMTQVPEDLPEVIGRRAREVTRGAESNFAKAVALQDWFRQGGGFRYSLEQRSGSGMDLLASFVSDDRVGYCEQFAAAMAAMGRSLGIPSRVVVGFLDGTTQDDDRILYTSDDRHAWPEMYFSGAGWVRFEPTPGQRAGATPSWTRQGLERADPSQAPQAAPRQRTAPEADRSAAANDTADGEGIAVPGWRTVSLLVVLVLSLAPGLVRRFQRRRRLSASDPVHLAEGAWAELRATALDLGLDWPEQRSPREQARTVVDQVKPEDSAVVSLQGLLVQVEQGRYGPADRTDGVDVAVRARTVETIDSWRRAMAGSVDRGRGWRSRVWPVSVLGRGHWSLRRRR